MQYTTGRIHLSPHQEHEYISVLKKEKVKEDPHPLPACFGIDITPLMAHKYILQSQLKTHMPTQRKRRLVQSILRILLHERDQTTVRGEYETFFYHGDIRLAWNYMGGFNYAKLQTAIVHGETREFKEERFVVQDSFQLA
jgi:hypothetical protein